MDTYTYIYIIGSYIEIKSIWNLCRFTECHVFRLYLREPLNFKNRAINTNNEAIIIL